MCSNDLRGTLTNCGCSLFYLVKKSRFPQFRSDSNFLTACLCQVDAQLFDYLVVLAGQRAIGAEENIEVILQYEREINGAKVFQEYVNDKNGLFEILGASAHVREEGDSLEVDSNLVLRCAKLDFPADEKWFDSEEIFVIVQDEWLKEPTDKLEYQLRFSKVVKDNEAKLRWEDINGNIKVERGLFLLQDQCHFELL